jgi:hypothetical protein
MKFFNKWLARKLQQAQDDQNTCVEAKPLHSRNFEAEGMNITITGATGGKIVEFRKYNKQTDRSNYELYIINEEENFTESFSKIVSMEMLR